MAGTKVTALLIFFFTFTGLTLGLDFQVGIEENPDLTTRNIQYSENISDLQKLSLSMENTGSIGCDYRSSVSYNYGNNTFTAYSQEHLLWPGSSSAAQMYFAPINYTGEIKATVNSEFCGIKREITNFSFNVDENTSRGENLSSETLEVSTTGAKLETSVKEGILVPQDAPPYWKVSSAQVENSTAHIEYEAPIFDDNETVTYAVIQNDTVKGFTEVNLKSQPSILEKLTAVDQKILYAVILLLLTSNIGLFVRERN